MTDRHDPDIVAAAETAARVILERLPLLASTDPATQARAHRLMLAVSDVLAAGAELAAQDRAARPCPFATGWAAGFRGQAAP